ncbi:hypothetical protein BKA58DRAFT_393066 [Alternaria rosae]|uniref:uncharacterized protein n=1 Tax=Alternaria rosae TaxID=1187941 RepID=UPI001E8DDBE8|nr:uncharacterized protein BKA58DRAFT_393066 [Alternaria rosae]KAH6861215.1 hypothetical protein BKA58DRAFT_393066 [Alternaria rosae]
MSTTRISPPYTPRSSPGSVPTADITQYYLDKDLIKFAGFITCVPPDLLYSIMSAATEADLRALLALINPPDLRIESGFLITRTCARVSNWLRNGNQRWAVSKDVIPCALFLLLKFRVLTRDGVCNSQTHEESLRLAVAVKTAYGNLCDSRVSRQTWADIMGRPYADIQGAEIALLKDLDFRTWVHEAEFKEFVGRFEIVWEMLLEDRDDVFF